MSDVAMTLATEGIRTCCNCSSTLVLIRINIGINGQEATPATLNEWLIGHGGYISGDLLVWNGKNEIYQR